MTCYARITTYQALVNELNMVENELKNNIRMPYELYTHLKNKQQLILDKIDECSLIYEIWYHFFDGTMAGFNDYDEKVESYADRNRAYERLEQLNSEDREKPYSIRVVELNG